MSPMLGPVEALVPRRALGALLLLAGLAMLAAGCSPTVRTHGHRLDEAALAQIEPGNTSREQVVQLLGSPSSLGTFDDSAWYYVSQRTETLSFYQDDVVDQNVVTITFDDRGVVQSVDRHGLEAARGSRGTDHAHRRQRALDHRAVHRQHRPLQPAPRRSGPAGPQLIPAGPPTLDHA